MRTINRRTLNQSSGKVLDEVIRTGEPVRVLGRDGSSVLITKGSLSTYERWVRDGLIRQATGPGLSKAPTLESTSSVQEILDDLRADR